MEKITKAAMEFFKKQGSIGGKKSAKAFTEQERSDRASKASDARWTEYRRKKAEEAK